MFTLFSPPAAASQAPVARSQERFLTLEGAKKNFFLDSATLGLIPAEKTMSTPTMFGAGRGRTFYQASAVRALAILKYGEEGFAKKVASKAKRESNKRAREDIAQQAAEELLAPAKKVGTGAASAPVPVAVDPQVNVQVQNLRKALLKQCRSTLASDRRTKVGNWRIEVPNVTPSVFAGLIFRPQDPELRTLVKNGAYYKVDMKANEFFAVSPGTEITGVGGKYGSNDQCKVDSECHLAIRYQPKSTTLSVSGVFIWA
jgi:hypothetical protein